jgi:TrmH family RNA methyltransferase
VKITENITSPANPHLKRATRLRDQRSRAETGLTLVDGLRELARAAAAGIEIPEVFVEMPADADSAWPGTVPPAVADCVAACIARGAAVIGLGPRAFARLAFGDRNEGVVGVVRFAARGLAEVSFGVSRPVLIAERVEKPGNLGAILRTVDAAGLGGVIACDPRTDPANPATIRASLGTVFSVPLAVAASTDVVRWCHESDRRVIVATPDAEQNWFTADLTGAIAIVVGSEAEGVSHAWAEAAADGGISLDAVRLPMRGLADSLNVSVTAAVLAYESVRQAAATTNA